MEFFVPMNDISPILLLLLGLCVGIMSGFYGIGGGWLITPALNILGMPMPYAIGTSLVYIVITSSLATIKHRKLKNVNFLIASITGLTATIGILTGKELIFYLKKLGNVDAVVRIIYVFFLAAIGLYMLFKNKINTSAKKNKVKNKEIPPFIYVRVNKQENIKISLYVLVFIGFFIGFLNSIMGVGGGFILLPLLIYVIKLPVILAVGTSLFTVVIAGFSGGIAYILSHSVDWASLVFMTATAIIGTTTGVWATQKVLPEKIKILFAATILCGGLTVLMKQLGFHTPSKIFIFAVAIFSALSIIIIAYFKQIKPGKLIKK